MLADWLVTVKGWVSVAASEDNRWLPGRSQAPPEVNLVGVRVRVAKVVHGMETFDECG